MRTALESENQVAEASAVSASLQPGVTIDLSRKNIHKLPEEVVDIMKNDLARYIPVFSRKPFTGVFADRIAQTDSGAQPTDGTARSIFRMHIFAIPQP
jgi:hypothetical protein